MKITVLYSQNSGVDYHRLLLPVKYFNLLGNDEITIAPHTDCFEHEELFDCDILFYSTIFYYDMNILAQLKRKYGFKLVLDLDDYPEPFEGQAHYEYWTKYGMKKVVFKGLKLADLVIVTNEQLKQVYELFTKKIVVIPNALPFDDIILERSPSKDIRFLYLAGNNHEHDFYQLKPLMEELAKDKLFQEKGSLTLCGYNKPVDIENVYDRMEKVANICNKYIRRDLLPLQEYMQHYNYGNVAIAPLIPNEYNACRSNLKFLEAACMKMPLICGEGLPYSLDKDAEGIIFCEDIEEWHDTFHWLLKNPKKIKELGEANYKYAKTHYNLLEVNKRRYRAMSDLVDLTRVLPRIQPAVNRFIHTSVV